MAGREPGGTSAKQPAGPLSVTPFSRVPPPWADTSEPPPALEVRARERLLDLAYDVSSRLRHHVRPAVRISAALLMAGSLAACEGDPPLTDDGVELTPAVEPLAQEVMSGLPVRPGRYPVVAGSVRRTEQGIYQFEWREPGMTDGPGTLAQASLLRLAESNAEALEILPDGDPILYLRHNSEVQLAGMTDPGSSPTRSIGSAGPSFIYWRPFFLGGTSSGPAYHNPPQQVANPTSQLDGTRASVAPAPAAQRTFGLSHAVSGRAGGTGSGTAATSRSGASPASSGGKSGATAGSPSSGGFSGGHSSTASGGGAS